MPFLCLLDVAILCLYTVLARHDIVEDTRVHDRQIMVQWEVGKGCIKGVDKICQSIDIIMSIGLGIMGSD